MNYSTEELLLDDGFRRWAINPEAEQNQTWATRVAEASNQGRESVRQARSILLSLPPEETLADDEVTQLWQAIQQGHLEKQTSHLQPLRQNGWTTHWYRIAAVFALVSLLGWVGWRTYSERTIAVGTSYGQQKQIILPDGSVVMLNGNSTLSYPANWAANSSREVSLEGEAYFKITKQQTNNQPVKFTVHSAVLNIEVVGTRFNVKNRRGDVNVVLDEGKVRISHLAATGEQPKLEMKPGDVIEFSKTRKTIRQQQVAHPKQYSSWMQNVLIFNNTPLRDIAQTLKDTYGITVTFADDSLATLAFTGNMPANNPTLILETLTKAFNLHVLRPGDDQVVFKAN